MKFLKLTALMLGGMFLLTGCTAPTATGIDEESITFIQYEEMREGEEIAVIETSLGDIKMRLFPNEAPKTVAQFKKLIEEGFFKDKPIFLEAEMKSMITGASDEMGAEGKIATDDGKAIEAEITPNLWHFSGAVSTLSHEKNKFSKTMLSDSRFFIIGDLPATTEIVTQMEEYKYPQKVINAYKEHGGLPQYTGAHTVFGQVYEGMDIVNKIVNLAVAEDSLKIQDGTKIVKITLEKYEKPTA